LLNSEFVQKIATFETASTNLVELQEKMKQKREVLNREALQLID